MKFFFKKTVKGRKTVYRRIYVPSAEDMSLVEVKRYLRSHPVEHKNLPDMERMLWAQNDFFTAAAIYQRKGGFWSCRQTAPCLAFLRGKSPLDGKVELLKRGYRWQWDNTFEQGQSQTETVSQSPLGGVIEPSSGTVGPRT